MAADNVAIRIDDFDTNSAVYNATTEFIEFGLEYGESMDLLPGANGNGTAKSIRSSLSSTISYTNSLLSYLWLGIKWFLAKTKTFWFVVIYSVIGAALFMYIEREPDIRRRLDKIDYHHAARDVLAFNIRQIQDSKRLDADYEIKQAIIQFEESIGSTIPSEESDWTFWMAILYAGTIYTTIGYGNIACVTTLGRLVTMIYAFIGIPMMIVVLDQLGDFLLRIVRKGSSIFEDIFLFFGVKLRVIRIKSEKSLKRYMKISKKMAFIGLSSGSMPPRSMTLIEPDKIKQMEVQSSQVNIEMQSEKSEDSKDDWKRDPPVLASVIVTIAWILASAATFCLWEDWTYFTSVYFFIISTSTIGFGDISPDYPEYTIAAFGIVIVGLSLVSVCINVVQEYLQQWYMSILQKMLEDYIEAQESGDENAAKGFMTGINNSQMKYFMPLISKNSGQKAMEQLKKEAKDKGIELPPALTELDPETGKPAFLNATEKEIDQLIEKAQSEGKLTPQPIRPPTVAVSIQASFSGDREIGQTQTELSWEFFEARIARETQFEPSLAGSIGRDVSIDARPKMTSTAIQPEVSSIFQFQREIIDDDVNTENIILARREAPAEGISGGIDEELEGNGKGNENLEVGFLRFLKNTGTQVQSEVEDFGSQTTAVKMVNFGQQKKPRGVTIGEQTVEKEVRAMKTQTKLTTCLQTPEELEEEKKKMKEEMRNEFEEEKAARLSKEVQSGKKRIKLDSNERKTLTSTLLKIRQEKVKKLRQEGKPIRFNIIEEKEILAAELGKIRKNKILKERQKQEEQRQALASTSTLDDDVFLADSEAGSSTSTLPGPDQFAVPSRSDFNRRLEEKKKKRETTFAQKASVEKRISVGDSTPMGRKMALFVAGKDEEESDSDEAEGGIELIHTPPEVESGRKNREEFDVVRSKSVSRDFADKSPRLPFESVSEENLKVPSAKFEMRQSAPLLTASKEGYEEITLNVELIRQSISSYGSSSQSKSIPGSMSPISKSSPSPTMEIHPEVISTSTLIEEVFESLTPDDIPMDELESLIEYDDLFADLESQEEQDEEIELFFLSTIETQTDMSYFETKTIGLITDPEKASHGIQTDLTALDDDRGPRNIVEALMPQQMTTTSQTTPMVSSEAIQTDAETEDKCVGGEVKYESTEIQTTEKETKDSFSETEKVDRKISVQTDLPTFVKESTQVDYERKDQATETELSINETAIQSGVIMKSAQSIQTDDKATSNSETQAAPRMSDSSTETDVFHVESATDVNVIKPTRDNMSQTETVVSSAAIAAEIEEMGSTAIQPDVSLMYKPEDFSKPDENVIYMVDTGTEHDYDLIMSHVSTQHQVDRIDFGQQHSPNLSHATSQAISTTVQATAQTLPRSRPPISAEEMDEIRRQRMMDIGIQTGVLARVQHIYGYGKRGGGDQGADIKRVTLRKVGSSTTPGTKQELQTETPLSLEEMKELLHSDPEKLPEPTPGPSTLIPEVDPEPEPELKESEKSKMLALHGRHWERQRTVSDLRLRIEKLQEQSGSKSGSDLPKEKPPTTGQSEEKKEEKKKKKKVVKKQQKEEK